MTSEWLTASLVLGTFKISESTLIVSTVLCHPIFHQTIINVDRILTIAIGSNYTSPKSECHKLNIVLVKVLISSLCLPGFSEYYFYFLK